MARLWSSGFELNSLTPGVEFDSATRCSIVTSPVRSETYAGRSNSIQGAQFSYQYAGNEIGPDIVYVRAYVRIASVGNEPDELINIREDWDYGASVASVFVDSDRKLRLQGEYFYGDTLSGALDLDTWYRIELKVDRTTPSSTQVEGKINGITFDTEAFDSSDFTYNPQTVSFGQTGGAVTAFDLYFDDIAINDSTGSSQNSWIGDEYFISLSDSVTVAETTTLSKSSKISVSDTINVSETTTASKRLRISVSDNITASESVTTDQTGRIWSCGFELNSTTNGVEVDSFEGTGYSIATAIKRSGSYAFRANPTADWSRLVKQYVASDTLGVYYFRFYIYIDSLPTLTDPDVIRIADTARNNLLVSIKINRTTSKFQIHDDFNNVSLDSSADIVEDTWYRLELKVDTTTISASAVQAKLNGVDFYTGSLNWTGVSGQGTLEIGLADTATADVYFDDIGINRNYWPGEGAIIHLRPNASGDVNNWNKSDGSAGDTSNYNQVDEVTPDDATTYLKSKTTNYEDFYNLTNTPGDINVINAIQVGVRFAGAAASANSGFKVELKKTTGGTIAQSAQIVPNSTSWKTNDNAAPYQYPLTLYTDPNGISFTNAVLNTTQIGIICTAGITNFDYVSDLWLLVDYQPTYSINVSDSTTVSETKASFIPSITRTASDNVRVSETLTIARNYHEISVSENIAVSEAKDARAFPLNIDIVPKSQNVEVSEEVTLEIPVDIYITDQDMAYVSETKSAFIPIYKQEYSDNVTVSETVAIQQAEYNINVADNITVSEAINGQSELQKLSVEDNIQVSEEITSRASPQHINVYDEVQVSEGTLAGTDFLPINVFDSVNVSEGITALGGGYTLDIFDSITVSETITSRPDNLVLSVFDSVSVSSEMVSTAPPVYALSITNANQGVVIE